MPNLRPPVDYIEGTRAIYASLGHEPYRWVRSEDAPPWTPLAKPVSQCRLALVGSGGVYRTGQVAFHHHDDTSFRVIASDTPASELRASHFAYDLSDARRDPNVVFPLDGLRRLVREGLLGGLGPRAYGFMGGIYSSRKVRELLAPALTERLVVDQVDLVLLVPV